MSVTRYELTTKYRGNESWDELEENPEGAYVRHGDYAALEQRLIESERYGRQTDITIDNLEMKLAQMAAELASVKQQEPKAWFIRITDEVTVDAREGEKWRGVPLVRIDVETPNHDAYLAEVQAQGVDMFSEKFGGGTLLSNMVKETAKDFAAQLRKGVQS